MAIHKMDTKVALFLGQLLIEKTEVINLELIVDFGSFRIVEDFASYHSLKKGQHC